MKSAASIASVVGLLGSTALASIEPLQFDITEVDLSSLQKRSDGDASESLTVSSHVLELRKVDGVSPAETWIRSIRKGPGADGLYNTGHVTNMTFLNGFEYIASIGFGDETLDVIVDSGSSDTWAVQKGFICQDVDGARLNDSSLCLFGPTYNGSFDGEPISGSHFNITYGDGEFATGLMGFQNITLAGFEVPHQQVALVNKTYWNGDSVASGLIGLAFDLLTSEYSDTTGASEYYSPIFTTMSKNGIVKPDLFSMAMDGKSRTGQLAFGGLPPVEVAGKFVSTPIKMVALSSRRPEAKTEYSFYTILPDGYVIKNTTLAPTSNETLASSKWNTAVAKPAGFLNSTTPTIVDSGTTLMYVPSDIAEAYANSIPGAFLEIFSGAYYAPCNATLPDFGIVINGHTFYANKDDLLFTSDPTDNGDGTTVCLLGVTDGGEGPYILGDTMMNSLVTVFDVGAGMMRFAHPCDGPSSAAFSGPWDDYNYAPDSRNVTPKYVLSLPNGDQLSEFSSPVELSSQSEGLVFDFGVEVGGIITVDYELSGSSNATLGLAFTEAKTYIGRKSDNSNGGTGADGALNFNISRGSGSYVMPDGKLRGGFRYLTLFLTSSASNVSLEIRNISLEISFQPTWSDLRAYQGYFYSSDELLNRIWYSGAYTLQTNSVPGKTGRVGTSTLKGGWQNDAYIGPGNTVLLDGAKRDRWVWIGDMGTAVPSAFVSTGDMESTKNALLAIYDNQASDGTLPKAGPPYPSKDSDTYHLWTLIGTYNYYLYTGDEDFLASIWAKYLKAVANSRSKVGANGVMNVTGDKDWGRWTYSNERSSASMLLYRALKTGADIASWAPELANASSYQKEWLDAAAKLQTAITTKLWDESKGAFKESPNDTSLYPQDANSMAVAFGVVSADSTEAQQISDYLESNWTPIGPHCPELKNNISPFISSIELYTHFRAGRADRALKLIRDAWGWYLNHPNGTESTVPEGYLLDGTWGYRGDRGYRNDPSYVSHAHGWSSGPTSGMTEYLVGLRVIKPGGSEWQFKPVLGELSEAEAGFTTSLGKFSAKFTVGENGTAAVEWDTPANTKGNLVLPGQELRRVKGGKGSATITL
ncbi:alpha-l-rhamnosidase [Colletotrichum karsti]|uniref:Alpha-l-rhamnosidase n=1 Tax=Colletotrichum karsti TaxID=1095194 RepID=A0A9P6LGS1_9PEZI|nr:alpha-l-rhamnosidase [Colletotrichum karsti]KAF9871875.1 alpha-l-rhamnosidase [Colletotrichum karsti]